MKKLTSSTLLIIIATTLFACTAQTPTKLPDNHQLTNKADTTNPVNPLLSLPLSNEGIYLYSVLIHKKVNAFYNQQRLSEVNQLAKQNQYFLKIESQHKYNPKNHPNHELINVYSDGVYPNYEPNSSSQPDNTLFKDDTFQDFLANIQTKAQVIHVTGFDQKKFLAVANFAASWIEKNTELAVVLNMVRKTEKEYVIANVTVDHNPSQRLGRIDFYINGSLIFAELITEKPVGRIRKEKTYRLGVPSGKHRIKVEITSLGGDRVANTVNLENKFFPDRTLHLVAIGINEFPNLPPKNRLRNAVNDARLVKKIFKEKAASLFKGKVSVQPYYLGHDQTTKAHIEKLIGKVRKNVRPNDYFIFFVSSHGMIFENKYYFVPSDFDMDLKVDSLSRQWKKSIRNGFGEDQISELLLNIPTVFRMAILDTCHAGKEIDSIKSSLATAPFGKKEGISILAAAKTTQAASDNYQGNGLFTHVFAKGLTGAADYNRDNIVDSMEIAQYVTTSVGKLSRSKGTIIQDAVVLPNPMSSYNRRFELTQLSPDIATTLSPNIFTPRESQLYLAAIQKHDSELMNGVIRNNNRHHDGKLQTLLSKPFSSEELTNKLSKYHSVDISISFMTGKTELAPREINKLKIIASALNNTPLKTKRIFIEGHADSLGDDDYNMTLSQARAEHVSYLLNQSFLVENDRLSALGFGELYPVGDNATPEGRAQNRRVSLFIYNE